MSTNTPLIDHFKDSLAALVEEAASYRSKFDESIIVCNAAMIVMDEAINHATSTLTAANGLLTNIKGLTRKSTTGTFTMTGLKDQLINLSFRVVDLERDYETSTHDAWKAWQDAIMAVVCAGSAQVDYANIVTETTRIEQVSTNAAHVRYSKSVGSTLRPGVEVVVKELDATITEVRTSLAKVPRTLHTHSTNYGVVKQRIASALISARGAVADAERRIS